MVDRIRLPGKVYEEAPRIELSRRAIIMGLAAGSVLPIASGCTTNPYTGETELAFFPDSEISTMAAAAWSDVKAQTPQSTNPRLVNSVNRTWDRIVSATPKANEQWDLAVFDTDTVNAFVMPGNRVGVYRGMVELSENEDQLSAVLGHEVGHSVKRHANKRASQQVLAQGALVAGSVAIASSPELSRFGNSIGALGGAAVQFGVILPFSRSHESEADLLGADYMHEAGFSVRESVRLWEVMDARSSGQRPPEFMSTHPDPRRRAADLRNYINAKGYDQI